MYMCVQFDVCSRDNPKSSICCLFVCQSTFKYMTVTVKMVFQDLHFIYTELAHVDN